MRSNRRKNLDNLYNRIENFTRKIDNRIATRKKLKTLGSSARISTNDYKNIIIPYWGKYNYKPKKYWYDLFCYEQETVDPRYIPSDLYYGEILPYFCNMSFRRGFEDKNIHDILFPKLKRPRTIAKNQAGVYYNSEGEIITFEELIALCNQEKKFLIKPAIDSGGGRLISLYDSETMAKDKMRSIIENFKSNFIIQEFIQQHPDLAVINESSINSVRIITFLFEGQSYVLSQVLRMGVSGGFTDNVSAGGIQCNIKDGGVLEDKAADLFRNWSNRHPNGVKFKDVVVPSFSKVRKICLEEQKRFAHFKMIGWDFAINVMGDPVFIEYNVCPGHNQMTCGPHFGDLTNKVLEEYFNKKTYIYANN